MVIDVSQGHASIQWGQLAGHHDLDLWPVGCDGEDIAFKKSGPQLVTCLHRGQLGFGSLGSSLALHLWRGALRCFKYFQPPAVPRLPSDHFWYIQDTIQISIEARLRKLDILRYPESSNYRTWGDESLNLFESKISSQFVFGCIPHGHTCLINIFRTAKLQMGAGKGEVFINHTRTKRMTCGIFSGGVSSAIGTPPYSPYSI